MSKPIQGSIPSNTSSPRSSVSSSMIDPSLIRSAIAPQQMQSISAKDQKKIREEEIKQQVFSKVRAKIEEFVSSIWSGEQICGVTSGNFIFFKLHEAFQQLFRVLKSEKGLVGFPNEPKSLDEVVIPNEWLKQNQIKWEKQLLKLEYDLFAYFDFYSQFGLDSEFTKKGESNFIKSLKLTELNLKTLKDELEYLLEDRELKSKLEKPLQFITDTISNLAWCQRSPLAAFGILNGLMSFQGKNLPHNEISFSSIKRISEIQKEYFVAYYERVLTLTINNLESCEEVLRPIRKINNTIDKAVSNLLKEAKLSTTNFKMLLDFDRLLSKLLCENGLKIIGTFYETEFQNQSPYEKTQWFTKEFISYFLQTTKLNDQVLKNLKLITELLKSFTTFKNKIQGTIIKSKEEEILLETAFEKICLVQEQVQVFQFAFSNFLGFKNTFIAYNHIINSYFREINYLYSVLRNHFKNEEILQNFSLIDLLQFYFLDLYKKQPDEKFLDLVTKLKCCAYSLQEKKEWIEHYDALVITLNNLLQKIDSKADDFRLITSINKIINSDFIDFFETLFFKNSKKINSLTKKEEEIAIHFFDSFKNHISQVKGKLELKRNFLNFLINKKTIFFPRNSIAEMDHKQVFKDHMLPKTHREIEIANQILKMLPGEINEKTLIDTYKCLKKIHSLMSKFRDNELKKQTEVFFKNALSLMDLEEIGPKSSLELLKNDNLDNFTSLFILYSSPIRIFLEIPISTPLQVSHTLQKIEVSVEKEEKPLSIERVNSEKVEFVLLLNQISSKKLKIISLKNEDYSSKFYRTLHFHQGLSNINFYQLLLDEIWNEKAATHLSLTYAYILTHFSGLTLEQAAKLTLAYQPIAHRQESTKHILFDKSEESGRELRWSHDLFNLMKPISSNPKELEDLHKIRQASLECRYMTAASFVSGLFFKLVNNNLENLENIQNLSKFALQTAFTTLNTFTKLPINVVFPDIKIPKNVEKLKLQVHPSIGSVFAAFKRLNIKDKQSLIQLSFTLNVLNEILQSEKSSDFPLSECMVSATFSSLALETAVNLFNMINGIARIHDHDLSPFTHELMQRSGNISEEELSLLNMNAMILKNETRYPSQNEGVIAQKLLHLSKLIEWKSAIEEQMLSKSMMKEIQKHYHQKIEFCGEAILNEIQATRDFFKNRTLLALGLMQKILELR